MRFVFIQSLLRGALCAFLLLSTTPVFALLKKPFSMKDYPQTLSQWIDTKSKDSDQPLLTPEMQKKRFAIFLNHYVGTLSPWNATHITHIVQKTPENDLHEEERNLIAEFTNTSNKPANEIGFDAKNKPHTEVWIDRIAYNINIDQLNKLDYQASQRGIMINNAYARALPTDSPSFYNKNIAGQGYPFDNLQISAVWIGTPVYIVGETRDHRWNLVITPDYIAWIKSNSVAKVDDDFVTRWSDAATHTLVAITHTKTPIRISHQKVIHAYVGTVFPLNEKNNMLMVPVINKKGYASIQDVHVDKNNDVMMPLSFTPKNIAMIIKTLMGRHYGWGGLYFDNDCSSEQKSLMTPFGIWLPRNSSEQVRVGKVNDLSASTPSDRLNYLSQHGKPFLTLIYLGHHIVLYIGEFNHTSMTYQNLWGLTPISKDYRAVIGKAVFLPLLLQYPQDKTLISQADKKYFIVSDLSELPTETVNNQFPVINLKVLMHPEMLLN